MKHYRVKSVTEFDDHVRLSLLPQKDRDQIWFYPGQYAGLSIKRDARWSPVRCFSFTNIPEDTGRLEFAFKKTGNFTQELAKLKSGDHIRLQGPFGEFTLMDSVRNVVFIAGGIGITPFMSMLKAAEEIPYISATLLYSVKNADEIPFKNEILRITHHNTNIKSYIFVSNGHRNSNDLISGRITDNHLAKIINNRTQDTFYYICGSESMMRNIKKDLIDLGVDKEQILTESFTAGTSGQQKLFGMTPSQITYALGLGVFLVLALGIGFRDVQDKVAAAELNQPTSQTQSSNENQTDDNTSIIQMPNSSSLSDTSTTPTQTPSTTNYSSSQSTSTNSTNSTTNVYQPPRSMMS